jgi:hypothetical protein
MKGLRIKTLSVIIAVGLAAGVLGFGAIKSAYADTPFDEMDKLFQTTLSEILDYENADDAYISAEKELLYDIDLNILGIIYSFVNNGTGGFAIIINDGLPQVTEISTDSETPYDGIEDTKVYITAGMYWYHDGEEFYECGTALPIDSESVSLVSESAYRGGFVLNFETENVYYSYKTETKYNIPYSIPAYVYGFTNGCAGVAGTNIIAYYDRWYPNLIPNYDAGTLFLGIYVYRVENTTTMAVAETLHNDMRTNVVQPGTTISQFKTGLTNYVNRQGYSVSYTSLMSWGSFSYSKAITAAQSDKAMALFMSGYRLANFTAFDGRDSIYYEYTDVGHVGTGFGCLTVDYILTNGSARTDRYIYTSSGLGINNTKAYINVAATQIDDAYAINIS